MTKHPNTYATYSERESNSINNSTIEKKLHLKIFIGIATLIICFFQFACNHSSSLPKGEVIILDTRNSKEPDENLATHKQYDVEVYRTFFPTDNAYSVRYYQKENDTLKSHSATYGAEDDFDKASYSWLNDTSVSIKLYSATSKKE